MNYFALMVLGVVLTVVVGCHPADVKSQSVKARLEAGQLVEFTEQGYLRPACSGFPWVDLRVSEDPERARVIVGKQKSSLNPGMKVCQQVGSTVYISIRGKGGPELGLVRVKKIGLIKAKNLTKSQMSGRFYADSDEFNKIYNDVTARLQPRDEGVVTIVTYEYLGGTAADEAQVIANEDAADNQPAGDGYQETQAEGQTVSTCTGAPWTDMTVPAALQGPLTAGQLKSVYRLGDTNCIPQGGSFAITLKRNTPGFLQAKALKIKKFKWEQGVSNYYVLNGYPYAELQALISADPFVGKANGWITVVDFELVTPPTSAGADNE